MFAAKQICRYAGQLLVLFCCASAVLAEQCSPPDFLPLDGAVEEWKRDGGFSTYNKEDLWEYIDGAAENFLSYRFECLTAQSYVSDRDETLNIEIYRHATPLMAFGIFTQFRDPGSECYSIGNDSFGDSYSLHMWKDRFYVKVMTYSDSEDLKQAMRGFARVIAEGITGKGELPPEIKCFPACGLVERSINFINEGVLGSTRFPPAFVASYREKESEGRLFIFLPSSGSGYRGLFHWYQSQLGEDVSHAGEGKKEYLVVEGSDKYRGEVLTFLYRRWMGVITGLVENAEYRRELAKKTVEKLSLLKE